MPSFAKVWFETDRPLQAKAWVEVVEGDRPIWSRASVEMAEGETDRLI
jgi:hypothetical protein